MSKRLFPIKSGAALAALIGLLTVGGAGAALADITTSITVKNNLNVPVTFRSPSGQILGIANPSTPSPAAPGGGTSMFQVNSNISTIAAIHFYFENGSRGCKFDTSYTTTGGYTQAAASSGGTFVSCSSSITTFNPTTHNYSITFTLN